MTAAHFSCPISMVPPFPTSFCLYSVHLFNITATYKLRISHALGCDFLFWSFLNFCLFLNFWLFLSLDRFSFFLVRHSDSDHGK